MKNHATRAPHYSSCGSSIRLQRIPSQSLSGVLLSMEFAALPHSGGIQWAAAGSGAYPTLEVRRFATLAEYSRTTHQDQQCRRRIYARSARNTDR